MSIFRPIIERLKSMFAVSAAQELENDLILRDAERRAELHLQADLYESEGLHAIANRLRQQAEATNADRPLAGVLPALDHLATDIERSQASPLALTDKHSANNVPTENSPKPFPRIRKKGAKHD